MVKSKVGSLSSADATEEKGDDHVVDDVADDLKLQQIINNLLQFQCKDGASTVLGSVLVKSDASLLSLSAVDDI